MSFNGQFYWIILENLKLFSNFLNFNLYFFIYLDETLSHVKKRKDKNNVLINEVFKVIFKSKRLDDLNQIKLFDGGGIADEEW